MSIPCRNLCLARLSPNRRDKSVNSVTLAPVSANTDAMNLAKLPTFSHNAAQARRVTTPAWSAGPIGKPGCAVRSGLVQCCHNSALPNPHALPAVFKLFRPRPTANQPPASDPSHIELRGTTTEGYHYALRLERSASGQAQRLIGWHGSSRGGARVEIQRDPAGVWRDLQGHHAAECIDLIPPPIRQSANWGSHRALLAPPAAAAPDAPSDSMALDLP